MPYIDDYNKRYEIDGLLEKLTSNIKSKGDLNYTICQLVGYLIVSGKISYTTISEWIAGVRDAEDELRRRILHKYEDLKIEENGDVASFIEIIKRMNGC